MKTELIEAELERLRRIKQEGEDDRPSVGSTDQACSVCRRRPGYVSGGGPSGKYCGDCARRVFTVGHAQNPEDQSYELFWVVVDEGEKPRYDDDSWLEARLRGTDGELAWGRYRRWNEIRDQKYEESKT